MRGVKSADMTHLTNSTVQRRVRIWIPGGQANFVPTIGLHGRMLATTLSLRNSFSKHKKPPEQDCESTFASFSVALAAC